MHDVVGKHMALNLAAHSWHRQYDDHNGKVLPRRIDLRLPLVDHITQYTKLALGETAIPYPPSLRRFFNVVEWQELANIKPACRKSRYLNIRLGSRLVPPNFEAMEKFFGYDRPAH